MIDIGNGSIADNGDGNYSSSILLPATFAIVTETTLSLIGFRGVAATFRESCVASMQLILGQMTGFKLAITASASPTLIALSDAGIRLNLSAISSLLINVAQRIFARVDLASEATTYPLSAQGIAAHLTIMADSSVALSGGVESSSAVLNLQSVSSVEIHARAREVAEIDWSGIEINVFTKRVT